MLEVVVACPNALAASTSRRVTDRWFFRHFSIVAEFRIHRWTAEVSCPRATQPVWLACWVDTPGTSAFSASKVVQDIWDIYREELGTVPPDLVLALRSAFDSNCVDEFWNVWSAGAG